MHDMSTTSDVRAAGLSLERWRSKREIAGHYGFTIRWVERQVAKGMPNRLIGGQRRFQISQVDRWLDATYADVA